MPILEGELDKSKETDKDVSIDIDPNTQIYEQSADSIIASLKGDSLTLARVKESLPALLAGLQAASTVVPGGGVAIGAAIGIINAIAGKLQ